VLALATVVSDEDQRYAGRIYGGDVMQPLSI
jgi:hypothetical protein